jgi:hypothetical protein
VIRGRTDPLFRSGVSRLEIERLPVPLRNSATRHTSDSANKSAFFSRRAGWHCFAPRKALLVALFQVSSDGVQSTVMIAPTLNSVYGVLEREISINQFLIRNRTEPLFRSGES